MEPLELNLEKIAWIGGQKEDEPSHDKTFDTDPHDYNEPTIITRRTLDLSWRVPSDN